MKPNFYKFHAAAVLFQIKMQIKKQRYNFFYFIIFFVLSWLHYAPEHIFNQSFNLNAGTHRPKCVWVTVDH